MFTTSFYFNFNILSQASIVRALKLKIYLIQSFGNYGKIIIKQSRSSVGQSTTLIMQGSAVQICAGLHELIGGLAQLARALRLHRRGHRFDSDILHNTDFQTRKSIQIDRMIGKQLNGKANYILMQKDSRFDSEIIHKLLSKNKTGRSFQRKKFFDILKENIAKILSNTIEYN